MVLFVADVLRYQTCGVIDTLAQYEDVPVIEEEVVAVTAALEALNPWRIATRAVHERTCEAWGVEMVNNGVQRESLDIQSELRGVLIRYFKGAKQACARAAAILAKCRTLEVGESACEIGGSSSSAAVASTEAVDSGLVPEKAEEFRMQPGAETVGELLWQRGETLRKDLEPFNAVRLQGEDHARLRRAMDALEKAWTKSTRTEYRKVCTEWGVQYVVASVQKTVAELKAQLLEAVQGFLKEKVAVGRASPWRRCSALHWS